MADDTTSLPDPYAGWRLLVPGRLVEMSDGTPLGMSENLRIPVGAGVWVTDEERDLLDDMFQPPTDIEESLNG